MSPRGRASGRLDPQRGVQSRARQEPAGRRCREPRPRGRRGLVRISENPWAFLANPCVYNLLQVRCCNDVGQAVISAPGEKRAAGLEPARAAPVTG